MSRWDFMKHRMRIVYFHEKPKYFTVKNNVILPSLTQRKPFENMQTKKFFQSLVFKNDAI